MTRPFNAGPSTTVSNNTQPAVNSHLSGAGLFADLPPASRHAPVAGVYTSAYTSDLGLFYSNGTAWVGLATASNTPFNPSAAGLPAGVIADFSTVTNTDQAITALAKVKSQISLRPYFIDIIGQMPTACDVITGIATYPGGAYSMTVNGTAGTRTLTRTGGNPIADAGASQYWGACIYDPVANRWTHNAVTGTSGSTISLVEPLAKDITGGTLALLWDGSQGQHRSLNGYRAYADLWWNTPAYSMVRDSALLYVEPTTDFFYQDTFASPYYSPQWWKQYGGLANNAMLYQDAKNRTTTNKVLSSTTINCVSCAATGTGQGAELAINTAGAPGVFHTTCSTYGTDSTLSGAISVLADGVSIYSGTFYGTVKSFYVPFGNCTTLTVRVTSTAASTNEVRIGRTIVFENQPAVNPMRTANRFMLVGDSWFDTVNHPGFEERLSMLSSKPIVNHGVGGMTAAYPLTASGSQTLLDDWLDAAPGTDVVLIHFSINDSNASVPGATWAANMSRIAQICTLHGATPVIAFPEVTASDSQTATIQTAYQTKLGMPAAPVYFTKALAAELSTKTTIFNKRLASQKGPGLLMNQSEVGQMYIKNDETDVGVWTRLTGSTSPATITPA